jgi:hypothetical protein
VSSLLAWESNLEGAHVHRYKDAPAIATARGKALHKKIYGSNPTFNPQATIDACPDYAFVIRGTCPPIFSLF